MTVERRSFLKTLCALPVAFLTAFKSGESPVVLSHPSFELLANGDATVTTPHLRVLDLQRAYMEIEYEVTPGQRIDSGELVILRPDARSIQRTRR